MTKLFNHIHTHSDYSELDGLGKIEAYVEKAIEFGSTALAITDHGSTSGVYDLVKACEGTPIKPILGTEFYITTEYGRGHLIALAMDNEGWGNILKLQRYAFSSKAFNYKPCVDIKSLKKYNKGIIITSACIANPIGYLILSGREEEALEMAVQFQDIFGDRFYIELQSSTTERQHVANIGLMQIANKIGAEMILTNDCHYVEKEDAYAHEVLLAVQTKAKMAETEKRFRFDTEGYYFKNYQEMLLDSNVPLHIAERALANTLEIAERCNATIERGLYFPSYHALPKGQDGESTLRKMVTKNYKRNIIDAGLHFQEFADDVTGELQVICSEGFADYFLIVQDIVNYARRNGIISSIRGSGASSKTAFTLGISEVNPDPFNLLFERFLSNGRIPDFDIDLSDRDTVIDYLIKTYGHKNVAVVGSFNYLTTKAVIRKVLTAFDYPSYYITSLTKPIDELGDTLEDALKKSKPFYNHCKKNPEEMKVIFKLNGVISHASTHAGGVIIYPNIADMVPIRTLGEDRNKLIAYTDKKVLEWLGHVKFDLLGVESLTSYADTVKSIEKDTGERVSLYNIDFNDQDVYKELAKGDVSGIFQLANQAHLLIEQQPNCFEDIIAVNALLRPGVGDWNEYIARRRGKKYELHPLRRPYLGETFGIIAYQEQYEMDCKTFAGWTIAYADKHVRKNYNLKSDIELTQQFIRDGMSRGFSEELLTRVWSEVVQAASDGYSFNKSHATCYAFISYQSAWLKFHHPSHFYSGLMTKEGADQDTLANLIAEARRRGIEIMPPDINISTNNFTATANKIFYRLTSITQVGDGAIKAILQARPIKSIEDLISRTTRTQVKTNVIMNLIKSGCFDYENPNRFKSIEQAQKILDIEVESHPEFNKVNKAVMEKQSLGVYLSSHPLDQYHYEPFYEIKDNTETVIAGEIIEIAERKDKNGNMMAFITLSNQYGNVKCLVFSNSWKGKLKETFIFNQFVAVSGRKSGTSLLINKATALVLE